MSTAAITWGVAPIDPSSNDEARAARRRAAGVYYTPRHVVRYIVQATLDPLLAGGDLLQDRPPRVLDPSCGDGAFLLEVYRYLLERYLKAYSRGDPERFAGPRAARIERTVEGSWRLTQRERERILLASLFGVDIDAAAVEAAKQALTAALLECKGSKPSRAEPAQTVARLGHNLRCGNALIGPDFRRDADGQSAGTIHPFDWQAAFGDVLTHGGGFDAVVGNPPYVNVRRLTQCYGASVKRYLADRYRCARGGYDLYVLFLEQAQRLLRRGGMCGMIVPNKIATLDYAAPCREMLLRQTTFHRIDDAAGLKLFPDANVYPYILVWQKTTPPRRHRVAVLQAESHDDLQQRRNTRTVAQADLSAEKGLCIHGALDVESRVATKNLAQRAELHSGTTGFAAQDIAAALEERCQAGDGRHFDFIVSRNVDRYVIRPGEVRFMKRRFAQPVLPAESSRLSRRKRELYRGPKLVLAGMSRRLETALDRGGFALGVQVYAVAQPLDDMRYLLALLNSKLLSYLFRLRYAAKRLAGGYLAINKGQLARLPIRMIDFDRTDDLRQHEAIVRQAEAMLTWHARLSITSADDQPESDWLRGQIATTDRRIDKLVYRLYCLSDDEIAQVERDVP